MNTHDIDIELPPEFRSGNSVPVERATIKRERMEEILRYAIEADRKRRQKPALTVEKIKIVWKETLTSMGAGGDPVLWFARAIERAHGISAPQPAESCESLMSDKTTCGSEIEDCDSQPVDPDSARCAECGAELIPVRPGKWQHPDCSQSSWAAEPVKVPSDDLAHEIWAAAQLAPGEGIVDGVSRIEVLLRHATHPTITHCDNCGCDWLDNGLNPVGCPYCKLRAEVDALREALEEIQSRSVMNLAMNPNPFALTAMLGDIHQIADAALEAARGGE